MLLHFGAVDWQTVVYVNTKHVGTHQGGYDKFSFDITDALYRHAHKSGAAAYCLVMTSLGAVSVCSAESCGLLRRVP